MVSEVVYPAEALFSFHNHQLAYAAQLKAIAQQPGQRVKHKIEFVSFLFTPCAFIYQLSSLFLNIKANYKQENSSNEKE